MHVTLHTRGIRKVHGPLLQWKRPRKHTLHVNQQQLSLQFAFWEENERIWGETQWESDILAWVNRRIDKQPPKKEKAPTKTATKIIIPNNGLKSARDNSTRLRFKFKKTFTLLEKVRAPLASPTTVILLSASKWRQFVPICTSQCSSAHTDPSLPSCARVYLFKGMTLFLWLY